MYALVESLDNGSVRPCKMVDFGCGFGNHTLYLSSRGFDITGVDISPAAKGIAQENARKIFIFNSHLSHIWKV